MLLPVVPFIAFVPAHNAVAEPKATAGGAETFQEFYEACIAALDKRGPCAPPDDGIIASYLEKVPIWKEKRLADQERRTLDELAGRLYTQSSVCLMDLVLRLDVIKLHSLASGLRRKKDEDVQAYVKRLHAGISAPVSDWVAKSGQPARLLNLLGTCAQPFSLNNENPLRRIVSKYSAWDLARLKSLKQAIVACYKEVTAFIRDSGDARDGARRLDSQVAGPKTETWSKAVDDIVKNAEKMHDICTTVFQVIRNVETPVFEVTVDPVIEYIGGYYAIYTRGTPAEKLFLEYCKRAAVEPAAAQIAIKIVSSLVIPSSTHGAYLDDTMDAVARWYLSLQQCQQHVENRGEAYKECTGLVEATLAARKRLLESVPEVVDWAAKIQPKESQGDKDSSTGPQGRSDAQTESQWRKFILYAMAVVAVAVVVVVVVVSGVSFSRGKFVKMPRAMVGTGSSAPDGVTTNGDDKAGDEKIQP